MSRANIPPRLTRAFREGRSALFIGAGASIAAGLPTWSEFVSSLCPELGLDVDSDISTAGSLSIAQYYENRFGRSALLEKVDEMSRSGGPSRIHELIVELPCSLFYTTNFDELLEDALRGSGRRRYATIANEVDARSFANHRGVQVRKLHGTTSRPDTITLTRNDFAEFRAAGRLTMEALRAHLAELSFLFIGYSLSDPDFSAILDDVVLTMGEMRMTHYFCAAAITDLERQDLALRGIEVIDLREWSTTQDPTDGLQCFLEKLSQETSDLTSVRRFFTGLEHGQEVPIIVSSRTHEEEQFVYIAECDLYVAQQVEQALSRLGCQGRRLADQRALLDRQNVARSDLVLICSPFGNAFTEQALRLIHAGERGARYAFDDHPDRGRALVAVDGERHSADNPVEVQASGGQAVEHALIARYVNPWNPDRYVFLFAGLHAIGTHAIGTFLSDPANFEQLNVDRRPLEVVLRVTYDEHDPYDYSYDVQPVPLDGS